MAVNLIEDEATMTKTLSDKMSHTHFHFGPHFEHINNTNLVFGSMIAKPLCGDGVSFQMRHKNDRVQLKYTLNSHAPAF